MNREETLVELKRLTVENKFSEFKTLYETNHRFFKEDYDKKTIYYYAFHAQQKEFIDYLENKFNFLSLNRDNKLLTECIKEYLGDYKPIQDIDLFFNHINDLYASLMFDQGDFNKLVKSNTKEFMEKFIQKFPTCYYFNYKKILTAAVSINDKDMINTILANSEPKQLESYYTTLTLYTWDIKTSTLEDKEEKREALVADLSNIITNGELKYKGMFKYLYEKFVLEAKDKTKIDVLKKTLYSEVFSVAQAYILDTKFQNNEDKPKQKIVKI